MKKLFYLTEGGMKELKAELHSLIVQRGPLAERIKAAREFGDLSENAEYSAARQQQDRLESRILQLETILENARLIQRPKDDGRVHLGSTVQLRDGRGREKIFQLVGTIEADPLAGRISDESPIGQALLGKRPGDQIEIKSPIENTLYAIVMIK